MSSFSTDTEPGIESDLIDLDGVPFTTLRKLDNESLRRSQGHVVERARRVRATYRSTAQAGGERVD